MVKSMLLLAVLACTFFIVTSTVSYRDGHLSGCPLRLYSEDLIKNEIFNTRKRCYFKDNFIFEGTKIKPKNTFCTKPHEFFNPCSSACQQKYCDNVTPDIVLLLLSIIGKCPGACQCEPGYYRNQIGECITYENCQNIENTTVAPPVICYDDNNNNNDIEKPDNTSNDGNTSGGGETTIDDNTSNNNDSNDDALTLLQQGNNALAGEFLYQLLKSKPGANFVASSMSLLVPLAQLALFATGTTYDQLINVINLKNKDNIEKVFPELTQDFDSQTSVIFKSKSKCYGNDKYPLSDIFNDESKSIFDAPVQDLNFDDPNEAANIINAWVANITDNLIPTLVSPSSFNGDTRLVLVNAIGFIGDWQSQFNADNTQDRDFYINETYAVKKPTMYQQGNFQYANSDTLNAEFLELRYKGGNFTYIIGLPKERTGITDLIQKLRNSSALIDVQNNLAYQEVNVYITKFNASTENDLTGFLNQINVTEIFKSSYDLKAILKNPEETRVTSCIQKSVIQVNEQGSKAAAGTAITVGATAVYEPQQPINFNADHPYVFFIFLQKNLMFCGAYVGGD